MKMNIEILKRLATRESLKNIFKSNIIRMIIFTVIVLTHIVLNFGLRIFQYPYDREYNSFVSLLYGAFNFPLAIFKETNIWAFSVNRVGDYFSLPLVIHLIYWAAVAVVVDHVIRQRDSATRYKQAFIVLAVFFTFTLLMHLGRSFEIDPISLLPDWI